MADDISYLQPLYPYTGGVLNPDDLDLQDCSLGHDRIFGQESMLWPDGAMWPDITLGQERTSYYPESNPSTGSQASSLGQDGTFGYDGALWQNSSLWQDSALCMGDNNLSEDRMLWHDGNPSHDPVLGQSDIFSQSSTISQDGALHPIWQDSIVDSDGVFIQSDTFRRNSSLSQARIRSKDKSPNRNLHDVPRHDATFTQNNTYSQDNALKSHISSLPHNKKPRHSLLKLIDFSTSPPKQYALQEYHSALGPGYDIEWEDWDSPGECQVRIYRPWGRRRDLPALVWCSEEGFQQEDRDHEQFMLRKICKKFTCAVVRIAFQRVPEDPCPGSIDDIHATYEAIVQAAHRLGMNGTYVFGGVKSGATLALATAIRRAESKQPPPAGLVLVAPAYVDIVPAYRGGRASFRIPEKEGKRAEMPLVTGLMPNITPSMYLQFSSQVDSCAATPLNLEEGLLRLVRLPPVYQFLISGDSFLLEGRALGNRLRKCGHIVTSRSFPATQRSMMAGLLPLSLENHLIAAIGEFFSPDSVCLDRAHGPKK